MYPKSFAFLTVRAEGGTLAYLLKWCRTVFNALKDMERMYRETLPKPTLFSYSFSAIVR